MLEIMTNGSQLRWVYPSPRLLVSIENSYISSLAEYDPIPTRFLRFV